MVKICGRYIWRKMFIGTMCVITAVGIIQIMQTPSSPPLKTLKKTLLRVGLDRKLRTDIFLHHIKAHEGFQLRILQAESNNAAQNLTNLTQAITLAKMQLLKQFPNKIRIETKHYQCINAMDQGFWSEIQAVNQVQTILVEMGTDALRKILAGKFYIAHSNHCGRLIRKGSEFDLHHIDKQCTNSSSYPFREGDAIIKTSNIDNITGLFTQLDALPPSPPQTLSPVSELMTVDYLNVIKDAVVTPSGNFHVGKHMILIERCFPHALRRVPYNVPTYPEVFSVAQEGAHAYFHAAIEELPRIMAALGYLLRNKHVKVHVTLASNFTRALLQEVGITPDRIVEGVVGAGTLLVPRGTRCGCGAVYNVNALFTFLNAQRIKSVKQDTIILIKRSHRRWFEHHSKILWMIYGVALKLGLRVRVYGDAPIIGLRETRELFQQAVMVVAPHGAGLLNMVFSQRGTCVVEGLCYAPRTGKMPLIFQHLAYILGHRYHGVTRPYQCMEIKPADLAPSINQCLADILNTTRQS